MIPRKNITLTPLKEEYHRNVIKAVKLVKKITGGEVYLADGAMITRTFRRRR